MKQKLLIIFSLHMFILLHTNSVSYASDHSYVTKLGYGPDKWASIWLIEKEGFNVNILSNDEEYVPSGDSISFDLPSSQLNRTGSSTTFDSLLVKFSITEYVILKLGSIIHEIEIGAWRQTVSQEARIVELGYRNMQLAFGRHEVTSECYHHFFDNVVFSLYSKTLADLPYTKLIPSQDCMQKESITEPFSSDVPTITLQNAFDISVNDNSILFVDTRETWEFDEGHIPGAINIKLREVEDSLDQVKNADLVIAYCVKDFRGYEAARAFRKHGINAAIMKPHGMRGWIEAGLPVAGTRGMPEDEALAALEQLARDSFQ